MRPLIIETDGPGPLAGNVISATTLSAGAQLALFDIGPFGWRIRFTESATFDDGPGVNVTGTDIQGLTAHMYGHALGLGHSTSPGATMSPTISGSGVSARSIEAKVKGRTILRAKNPTRSLGRFAIRDDGWEQIEIRGKVGLAWLQGCADAHRDEQWTAFEKTYDARQHLPRWLLANAASGAAATKATKSGAKATTRSRN